MRSILLPAAMSLLLGSPQETEKPRAVLEGLDAIAPPGTEVIIRAKLERDDFFRRDIVEASVEFRTEGEALGSGITGGLGIARVSARFETPGLHEITASLPATSAYTASPATIRVLVLPTEQAFVLCDVDGTLTDVPDVKLLVTPNEDIEPREGLADSLSGIADAHPIVYISRRPALRRKTRSWMADRGLPDGPMIFWGLPGAGSPGGATSMRRRAKEIRATWPGIVAGIAGSREAVEALSAAGIPAYSLGAGDDAEGMPEGARPASSWEEIRDHLLGSPEVPSPPAGDPPGTGGEGSDRQG